jgi:hypothetical protein
VALLAALLLASRERGAELAPFAPLLVKADRRAIERAAMVLALSDDIEERCPPDGPLALRCAVGKRGVTVTVPALLAWRPRGLAERFERVFARRLEVVPGGA